MDHKISVVVTVLNEEQTLSQLMEALINQSHSPSEVIIVDGGSNDQTTQILSKYQQQHLPFKLVTVTKVGNRSVGRNTGIELAHHTLIALTDAGCVPHHNWLEALLAMYAETQAPVIAGYYDAKPKTAFETAVVPYVLVMPDRVNPHSFLPATRSMLIEKAAWLSIKGFDERLSDNEDFDFALRLQAQEVAMVFAEKAKVRWIPRSNLKDFMVMIYRFARGDVRAGIVRPKVLSIFARYLGFLILVMMAITQPVYWLLLFLVLAAYTVWSIAKNYNYAPKAWYWLPVLQYASDMSVMVGSIEGYFKRLK